MSPLLLNPRHEAFAQAIARQAASNDRNPTAAGIEAGYQSRGHSLDVTVSRTLKRADVRARIAELRKETLDSAGLSRQWIVEQAMFEAIYGTQRASALRLLAEIEGLVGNYRVEHSGPNGGPIPLLAAVAELTDHQLALLIEGRTAPHD